MFEKILEKLIISYFGKYINGLDQNNVHLGVFKGNVKIENVSLKPEIMDLLDLPIDIKFSNIGSLTLNIPWSKLSSSPVPISLENIYLIIGPKKSADWNFTDKASIEKKLEDIEAYAKQCLSKFAKKKKSEDKGYIEKMSEKIIDNIQLSFKNIHLRWEDAAQGFSFGITLKDFQANTTDSDWKPAFIDRSTKSDIKSAVYKLLSLEGLRVYWNSRETDFLATGSKYQIYSLMQNLIDSPQKQKNVDVVININADFKFTINHPSAFDYPQYELIISLDWIDLHLKHQQLQQISDLVNLSIQYRDAMWASRKKVVEVSEEMQDFYKKHFVRLFTTRLKNIELKEKAEFEPQDVQILSSILKSIDYGTLCGWLRRVVKTQIRENKLHEMMNKGKGLFSSSVSVAISAEQLSEIERLIEEELEATKKEVIQRPNESIFFCTSFMLRGGSIFLSKINPKTSRLEGLKLIYNDLQVFMNTTEDNGQEIFIKLKDIAINLQGQGNDEGNSMESIPFLYKQNKYQLGTTVPYFVKFVYKRYSINQKKLSTAIKADANISCQIEPLECVYNPKVIERIREFFEIQSQHEYFSQMIVEQKKKEDPTQNSLDSIFKIGFDVRIGRQTIILPLNNEDNQQPCWVFSLHSMHMEKTSELIDIYEPFKIQIKKTSLVFAKNLSQVHQENNDAFVLFSEYDIEASLHRQVDQLFDATKPLIKVDGVFEPLKISFSKRILSELIRIQELISPSFNMQLEKIKQKKEQMIKSAVFNSIIKYREKRYQKYNQVRLIIDQSDRAFLFYEDPNSKQFQPFLSIHANSLLDYTIISESSELIKQEMQSESQEEQIPIERISTEIQFQSLSFYIVVSDSTNWASLREILQRVKTLNEEQKERGMHQEIHDFEENEDLSNMNEGPQDNSKLEKQESGTMLKRMANDFSFIFKSLQIQFQENERTLIDISVSSLKFHRYSNSTDFINELEFQELMIVDHVFTYQHEIFQPIFSATSQNGDNSSCLTLQILEDIKNEQIKINTNVKECIFNLKPDSLLVLQSFIKIFLMKSENLQELEVQNKTIPELINEVISDASFREFQSKLSNLSQSTNPSSFVDYEISLENHYCNLALVNFSVLFKDIQIHLIQHQTHVPLLRLQLQDLQIQSKKTKEAFFMTGNLPQLVISDLTNYPNTGNADSSTEIPALVILEKQEFAPKSDSLFSFKYSSYDQVQIANFNSFFKGSFSPVSLTYQQQPMMRLIDYVNNQIIALIQYPDQIANQQPKPSNGNEVPFKLNGSIDQVIRQIVCPTFMHMEIELQSLEVVLKGLPDEEGFVLQMDTIILESVYSPTKDRFTTGFDSQAQQLQNLWICSYNIKAVDCQIKMQDSGLFRQMSLPYQMNLKWEQLMFLSEVTFLWPHLKKQITKGNRLSGNISSVFMRLTQFEYTRFIRMLLHNFTYDDQMDQMYILNYEHVVALEPNPIDVVLEIDGISIVKSNDDSFHPEAIIFLKQNKIKWMKDSLKNMKLQIIAKELLVSEFTFDSNEEIFQRKDLIGSNFGASKQYTLEHEIHRLVGVGSSIINDFICNEDSEQFCGAKGRVIDEKDAQLHFRQTILRNSGDQDLNFGLQNLKILLQTDTIMNLLIQLNPSPSCYPQYKRKEEQNRLVFIMNAKNIVCACPLQSQGQVIALRGDLSVIFVRQRMQNHENLREKLIIGNLQSRDLGDLYTYNISCDEFQIFSCDFDEISEKDFRDVRKRTLLHPMTASFKSKYELYIGPKPQQSLYFIAKNDANIHKTKITFSFKNLTLLHHAIQEQLSFLKVKEIDEVKGKQQNQDQIERIPTNSTVSFDLEEMLIHLINDAEDASVPVVMIKLFDNSVLLNYSDNEKKNISLSFGLQLSYFNPQCSVWEPIIERNTFIVDFALSPQSNLKRYISFESNNGSSDIQSLNINISSKMMNSLFTQYVSLKEQIESFLSQTKSIQNESTTLHAQKKSKNSSVLNHRELAIKQKVEAATQAEMTQLGQSNINSGSKRKRIDQDNVEFVSPLSILNNIGYPICIESEGDQVYVVQNNETVNYLVEEHSSYDSFSQAKINISILSEKHTFSTIRGISVTNLKKKVLSVSSTNQSIRNQTIIIDHTVQTNRKILQIHSLLALENQTGQILEVIISPHQNMEPGQTYSMEIQSGGIQYVPFDRLQHLFKFKYSSSEGFSDWIHLQKLMGVYNETSYELSHNANKHNVTTFLRIKNEDITKRVIFEPFIRLKNCLPMNMEIDLLIENEKKRVASHMLTYQETLYNHDGNLRSKVLMKIRIPGFQGSDYLTLSLPLPNTTAQQNNIYIPQYFHLIDYRGCTFPLSVKTDLRPFGAKTFIVYSPCIMISRVPNDIFIFIKKGDSISFAPGQKIQNIPETEYISHLGKVSLLSGNEQSILLSSTDQGTKLSKPLNITGIGKDTIEVLTNQDSNNMLEVFIDISLQEVDSNQKIFSKIIQLSPKYIVVNKTQYTIILRQENTQKDLLLVNPQSRIPFSWSDISRMRNYNVLISDPEKECSYGWSGTLNLSLSSICFAARNPKDFRDIKNFKVNIDESSSFFYIQFSELKKDLNPAYTIENKLAETKIVFFQGCFYDQRKVDYHDNLYALSSGQKIDYAQDLPTLANDIVVIFEFEGQRKNDKQIMEPIILNLECPELEKEFKIISKDGEELVSMFVIIRFEGSVKTVTFLDKLEKENKNSNAEIIEWQVEVSFPEIGISLIGDDNTTKEIVFINLKSVELAFVETSEKRTTQLKVQGAQIDNNFVIGSTYPILMTALKPKLKIPVLSFVVEQDISAQRIVKIQSCRFAIQPMSIKVTDDTVNALLKFFNVFTHPLLNDKSTSMISSKVTKNNDQKQSYLFDWATEPISEKTKMLLVQDMELYPIKLNLSFKKVRENKGDNSSSDFLSGVLKAIGVAFANVEGADITLKGIKYQNIIGSQNDIFSRLMSNYKSSLVNQSLSILGSVNIIGNPIGLFKNIGTGVTDLIEMPRDGFVKGPIEGGVGVVLGAGSLLKKTVSGTFGSVQGITDSIGTGLSQLSLDSEFQKEREKQRNKKAKHVGQGVKLGLKSIFTGFGEGIVGLVQKPIEGAEQEGAVGLLKGITKGFAGLLFKPISGVVDAASKTAEGIKNTATYFDDKPTEIRSRLPRAFYSSEKYFADYSIQDAELIDMLRTYKKGIFSEIQLVASFTLQYKSISFILIISVEKLILLNIDNQQQLLCLSPSQIDQIYETDQGVVLQLKDATPEFPGKQASIFVENQFKRTQIFKGIFSFFQN